MEHTRNTRPSSSHHLCRITDPPTLAAFFIGFSLGQALYGPIAERVGSASALFGTLQYTAATISSVVVGQLHDATPWPMAAVIGCCGVLAWCAGRFLVPAGASPRVSVVEPID